MTRADQDRAAARRVGLVPVSFTQQPRPCAGPDEPACIQALCVDCSNFSTAPSLHTPMQPAARFSARMVMWQCGEFHAATVAGAGTTRKAADFGGEVAPSSAGAGLAA